LDLSLTGIRGPFKEKAMTTTMTMTRQTGRQIARERKRVRALRNARPQRDPRRVDAEIARTQRRVSQLRAELHEAQLDLIN
jgi:hypothetical protein